MPPMRSSSSRVVDRFLSLSGAMGRTESLTGIGRVPAGETEIAKLAEQIARAAQDDPIAFAMLKAATEESAIRAHIAGAVAAIRAHGREASLDEHQQSALEAIVLLTGRPALFVRNNRFELPHGQWELLAPYRDAIGTAVQSVGRLAVHPEYGVPYAGTGFIVGEALVLTNRHVVAPYMIPACDGFMLDPLSEMTFDVRQEFGESVVNAYAVEAVVWIDFRPEVDLALLRLATAAAPQLPAPLALQSDMNSVRSGNTVYVVGFPAADSARNDAIEMERIFGSVYGKKRLAPGTITAVAHDQAVMEHDCSTLGGNSGSCVIDLTTNSVVGMHFEGSYRETNRAVLLPALATDTELRHLNWRSGRHV